MLVCDYSESCTYERHRPFYSWCPFIEDPYCELEFVLSVRVCGIYEQNQAQALYHKNNGM